MGGVLMWESCGPSRRGEGVLLSSSDLGGRGKGVLLGSHGATHWGEKTWCSQSTHKLLEVRSVVGLVLWNVYNWL